MVTGFWAKRLPETERGPNAPIAFQVKIDVRAEDYRLLSYYLNDLNTKEKILDADLVRFLVFQSKVFDRSFSRATLQMEVDAITFLARATKRAKRRLFAAKNVAITNSLLRERNFHQLIDIATLDARQAVNLKDAFDVAKRSIRNAGLSIKKRAVEAAKQVSNELLNPEKKTKNQYFAAMVRSREQHTLKDIGSGTYGLVQHFSKGRFRVAVKQVWLRHAKSVKWQEFLAVKEVLSEVTILKECKHPSIIGYFDSYFDESTLMLYIFMEYAKSGNLRTLIESFGGILSESMARKFALEILEGLIYLHGKAIIHRDLKPENILISDDFHAKLCDFGMAKHEETIGTTTNEAAAGTWFYMAPELFKNNELTPKILTNAVDIWAFGVTVLEMLSGQRLYPKVSDRLQYHLKLVEHGAEKHVFPWFVSPEARSFVELALKKNCSERYSAKMLKQHDYIKTQQN